MPCEEKLVMGHMYLVKRWDSTPKRTIKGFRVIIKVGINMIYHLFLLRLIQIRQNVLRHKTCLVLYDMTFPNGASRVVDGQAQMCTSVLGGQIY